MTETTAVRPQRRDRGLAWRAAAFLAVFALLQTGYTAAKGTWLEHLVIDQLTVRTAARLLDFADPTLGVVPEGPRLRAVGGGINVLNGCEGMDVVFLMMAAMLVAPLPLRARMVGFVAGTVWVLFLNQFRIIALFYAFRSDKAIFDVLHGVVSPLVLIIAAAGFFIIWLNRRTVVIDHA